MVQSPNGFRRGELTLMYKCFAFKFQTYARTSSLQCFRTANGELVQITSRETILNVRNGHQLHLGRQQVLSLGVAFVVPKASPLKASAMPIMYKAVLQ